MQLPILSHFAGVTSRPAGAGHPAQGPLFFLAFPKAFARRRAWRNAMAVAASLNPRMLLEDWRRPRIAPNFRAKIVIEPELGDGVRRCEKTRCGLRDR